MQILTNPDVQRLHYDDHRMRVHDSGILVSSQRYPVAKELSMVAVIGFSVGIIAPHIHDSIRFH